MSSDTEIAAARVALAEHDDIEIDVLALVGQPNPTWRPAVFRRAASARTTTMVVIRIDVTEGHPWFGYNGREFHVCSSDLYRRRGHDDVVRGHFPLPPELA